MTEHELAISLRGISKLYRLYGSPLDRLKDALPFFRSDHHREFWALNDVSLDVRKGETVGIIGVNGSGKSTLLQIVCGLLQPTSGQVQVRGRISALLELGSGFDPELPGRDNVYLQGAILGLSKQEVDERLQSILDFAEIGDFIDQPVKTYSSGMMIRLAFSVAIQVEPEVLIVDEALAVGDVFFQAKCFAKMQELKSRNITILLVTHDMNSVRSLCDRALCLDSGKTVAYGKASEVVEAYFKERALKQGSIELSSELITECDCDDIQWDSSDTNTGLREQPVETQILNSSDRSNASTQLQYGNAKAILVKYLINGVANCKEAYIETGGVLEVETYYDIRGEVQNPIFGLMLKTPIGIEIYGNNTTYAKKVLAPLSPGQTSRACFTQKLLLNNGPYLLTLTIAEWIDHKVVYIDRKVGFVVLNVVGGPVPHIGFCNFAGSVDVEKIDSSELG
ncbi:MAG: ABC transporter ATP-binding protein [Desulfovibrio sp.]